MPIKIILIYCICDDFLSAFGLNDDKQCRMTSAEILTWRSFRHYFLMETFPEQDSF